MKLGQQRITMKTNLFNSSVRVLILATALAVGEAARAEEKPLLASLKLGNTVVTNVRVMNATPTHVTFTYDGCGGSRIHRLQLPPELAALFPYDAKEAARYELEQEKERAERARKEQARQAQARLDLKITLLRQRQSVKERVETIERERDQLEQQIHLAWSRAVRRPHSPERQEYNNLLASKQSVLKRLNEQQDMLTKIDRQLATLH